jgi:hypothetical protein
MPGDMSTRYYIGDSSSLSPSLSLSLSLYLSRDTILLYLPTEPAKGPHGGHCTREHD